MRGKELIVGEEYILKKNPGCEEYWWAIGEKLPTAHTIGYYNKPRKGTVFKCIAAAERLAATSTFVITQFSDGTTPKEKYKLTTSTHTSLQPYGDITAMSPREQRVKRTKAKIQSLQAKRDIARMQVAEQEKLAAAADIEVLDAINELDLLERYETDEEELAATLAEIINTGGDAEDILAILTKRTTTSFL